jgi:transcriptional regulator with XRE-family HTH domain
LTICQVGGILESRFRYRAVTFKEVKGLLGTRVLEIANRLGQTQRAMAELLGFHESTLKKWVDRETVGQLPDTKSYQRVSQLLLRDIGWLYGEADAPEWSPRMRKLQGLLRDLACTTAPAAFTSTRARLMYVYDALKTHLPELDDRVWAWHLYWDTADWDRLVVDPEFMPGEHQLRGVAAFTTIPTRWFIDGSTECLQDMPSDELRELGRWLTARNMDTVDAKRELEKRRNPRP